MRIVAMPLIVAVRLNVSCKISTTPALLHTFGSYASKCGVGEKFQDLEMSCEAIRRERMYRDLAPVARASREIAIGRTPENFERERKRERETDREIGNEECRSERQKRQLASGKKKKSKIEVCLVSHRHKTYDPRGILTCCKRECAHIKRRVQHLTMSSFYLHTTSRNT